MANKWYIKSLKKLANGSIAWEHDPVRCVAVSSGYSVNLGTHEYLSDVGSSTRIVDFGTLTSKTNTLGTLDAGDLSKTSVTGSAINAVILYKWTGTEASSPLLTYMDTGTGFGTAPNQNNVNIAWSNGASKITRVRNE